MDLKISKEDRVLERKANPRGRVKNYLALSLFAHAMLFFAMLFFVPESTPHNASKPKGRLVYASVVKAPVQKAKSPLNAIEEELPIKNTNQEIHHQDSSILNKDADEKKAKFSDKMKALDDLLSKKIIEQTVPVQKTTDKAFDWGFDEMNESTLDIDIPPVAIDKGVKNSGEDSIETPAIVEEKVFIDPLVSYQRKIVKALQGAMRIESSMKGSECFLSLNISKDGLVISATPVRGKQVLCEAAEQASLRVGKLPMPEDPRLYPNLKKLTIIISP